MQSHPDLGSNGSTCILTAAAEVKLPQPLLWMPDHCSWVHMYCTAAGTPFQVAPRVHALLCCIMDISLGVIHCVVPPADVVGSRCPDGYETRELWIGEASKITPPTRWGKVSKGKISWSSVAAAIIAPLSSSLWDLHKVSLSAQNDMLYMALAGKVPKRRVVDQLNSIAGRK